MPSSICAIVNTSSDPQNGRVVSRAMARDPTMLLTAYQPLALTQFKSAGRYAPRRPKLMARKRKLGHPNLRPHARGERQQATPNEISYENGNHTISKTEAKNDCQRSD